MIWNIAVKEIRELLTFTTIAAIVLVTGIFASMGGLVSYSKDETTKKPVVAILNLDHGPDARLGKLVVKTLQEGTEVIYLGGDVEAGLSVLRAHRRGSALIEITDGFTRDLEQGKKARLGITWIMRGAGALDTISSAILERHLLAVNRAITVAMIKHDSSGVSHPETAVDPVLRIENTFFKEKLIPMLSPARIAQILTTQSITIPIIMMIILMLGGSVVVSSMGLEKENKTLETLLTLPVSRRTLVLGKLLGSAVVALLMAAVFSVGFHFYIRNFQAPAESLEVLGLALGMADYILVGVSLFASLLFGLAFALLLGVLARDYKTAQMLTYIILVLAMFPMMVVMLKDFDTIPKTLQVLLFVIPFSHPMMAMRNLALENAGFVMWGILYSLVASALLTAAVVRVFRSEVLVTGILRFHRKPSIEA